MTISYYATYPGRAFGTVQAPKAYLDPSMKREV